MAIRIKFIAYFKNSTSTLVEKFSNDSGKEVLTIIILENNKENL